MRRGEEAGFTLLELVFALVLLSIGVAALVGVLTTAFRSTAVDIHRTDATAIAAQGLTELAATPVTGSLPSVTRNGVTYALAGTVTRATASNGDADAYPALTVKVTWTDAGGPHTLTQSTARFISPPTTAPTCTPLGAVTPVVSAPAGDPSVDVSWQEPSGGPVERWQVQVSTDGTTWTTAVDRERPLAPGATHQLEIGGVAGAAAYQVQVVAVTACGGSQSWPASGGTTAAPATGCDPGSMTLGPATADRVSSGAAAGTLTSDVSIVVTADGTCTGGLLVTAQAINGTMVTGVLSPSGPDSYAGTLPGLTQQWDLGLHQVQAYSASSWPSPIATGVLCIEAEGASAC